MEEIIGWDLGGANIKHCHLVGGRPVSIAQTPCPVIPDRAKFDRAVNEALSSKLVGAAPALHAVTMTGELSDVFASRAEGVAYLVGLMRNIAGGTPLSIYGGRSGFLSAEAAAGAVAEIASANWHASARLAADAVRNGLFVDIGTTTSDIIPLRDRAVVARGYTDGERLLEGELVYTGVVRTPVMAIGQRAPFRGRMQGVAAERFATMADIWRLTGALPEDADTYAAADHRGKSLDDSAARLARMMGRDAVDAPFEDWVALARWFGERQLDQLEAAASVIAMRERLPADAPVIGAGCGRFLAERLAERLHRPYRSFAAVIGVPAASENQAAICAPAISVALLARRATATQAAG